MAKGKKSKSNHKQSSGSRAFRERARQVRRLKMKVKRWEKYKASGKPSGKNRKKDWDTSGLLKQIAFLETL